MVGETSMRPDQETARMSGSSSSGPERHQTFLLRSQSITSAAFAFVLEVHAIIVIIRSQSMAYRRPLASAGDVASLLWMIQYHRPI